MPLDTSTSPSTTTTTPLSPQQPGLPISGPSPSPSPGPRPFLYPYGSPSRPAFLPRGGVRPLAPSDVAAGFPLAYSHGVRAMASPHLENLNRAMHVTMPPPHLHYPLPGPPPSTVSRAFSPAPPKIVPRSAILDSNGSKDTNTSTRERSTDDTIAIIRDRKVKITENASLYALCRSWLKNGVDEESQPQQKDVMISLPQPLPAPTVVSGDLSKEKEDENVEKDDEQEENERSVDDLTPEELLKEHIGRAKRVKARMREERLQRISRYTSRLKLLLPPSGEPPRNDTAGGN